MNRYCSCAVLSLVCLAASSKNLGNYGEVFPVIEQDIREVIMRRLHAMEVSGELERRKQAIQQRVAEHVMRPKPLNLEPTSTPSVFHVDPSITVNQDVFLPDGTLAARAGTRLNPFETIHFSKTLIFFNGDDKAQLAWVKAHYQDYQMVKFILTGGDIRDASERFGRVYFDVDGKLSQQLHLRHVPSVVSQDGLVWRIQEIGASR